MHISKPLVSSLVMLVSSLSLAQVPRDRFEKAQDRHELRQDARETWDDRQDLAKLEALLARFDRARSMRDLRALGQVDADLSALIRQEWSETRYEGAKNRAEAQRSAGELHSDRRDVTHDAVNGRPGAFVQDKRDLRDDRRDLRDDQRDARLERDFLFEIRRIGMQLEPLYNRHDGPALGRKRSLVVQMIDLARRELAKDRQESREDHRELREDRRELRQDVRRH